MFLDSLKDLTIRLNHLLKSHQALCEAVNQVPTTDSHELRQLRWKKISPTECKKCRKEGLCFFCGIANHFMDHYPISSQKTCFSTPGWENTGTLTQTLIESFSFINYLTNLSHVQIRYSGSVFVFSPLVNSSHRQFCHWLVWRKSLWRISFSPHNHYSTHLISAPSVEVSLQLAL